MNEPIVISEIVEGCPEQKIYAYRKFKVCPSGMHKPTGKKEDVTDQINRIIRRQITRLCGGCTSLAELLYEGLKLK